MTAAEDKGGTPDLTPTRRGQSEGVRCSKGDSGSTERSDPIPQSEIPAGPPDLSKDEYEHLGDAINALVLVAAMKRDSAYGGRKSYDIGGHVMPATNFFGVENGKFRITKVGIEADNGTEAWKGWSNANQKPDDAHAWVVALKQPAGNPSAFAKLDMNRLKAEKSAFLGISADLGAPVFVVTQDRTVYRFEWVSGEEPTIATWPEGRAVDW